MKLRDYMHYNKITCKKMAKDLGIHYMYVSAIKNGKRIPSLNLSISIEMITGGEVTIKELREKEND
jgi:DNA-binding transcriptional regulator YdaS (Cro superfamily)